MGWQFAPQQPIYQQLVDHILTDILCGRYEKGARLPSVRDLALEAAVNPNTMQRAMSELENRGLVQTQRNAGRTVTEDDAVIAAEKAKKAALAALEYIHTMSALGFERAQAIEFLKTDVPLDNNEEDYEDGTDSGM